MIFFKVDAWTTPESGRLLLLHCDTVSCSGWLMAIFVVPEAAKGETSSCQGVVGVDVLFYACIVRGSRTRALLLEGYIAAGVGAKPLW